MRTRVGYAGGTSEQPTYEDIGDHSESIQVDFDPNVISYDELLEAFWTSHDPCARAHSRQYASIAFFHDERQERRARETAAALSELHGRDVQTEVRPLTAFHRAEDYHQKWRLRRVSSIEAEYAAIYPELDDFVDSTAVMRANAYLGGYGDAARLTNEIDSLGLSAEGRALLADAAGLEHAR